MNLLSRLGEVYHVYRFILNAATPILNVSIGFGGVTRCHRRHDSRLTSHSIHSL